MAPSTTEKPTGYDRFYQQPNYFKHRVWVERPFVRQVVRLLDLRPGARVLDVGCGQGLVSHLLREHGFRVVGVDMSHIGLCHAKRDYAAMGGMFVTGDALYLPFLSCFDCVLTRSLSLYNVEDFSCNPYVTETLLRYVADGGKLVFLYNSRFDGRLSSTWRYHSLADARAHFSMYANVQTLFVVKILVPFLGALTFSPLGNRLSAALSRHMGMGGDIVCILTKSRGGAGA